MRELKKVSLLGVIEISDIIPQNSLKSILGGYGDNNMRILLKHASLFLAISVIISCSSSEQSNNCSMGAKIIRIDPNSRQRRELTLSEIIDSITYIPLETNENCLLGTIHWDDFIYSDNYILLMPKVDNKIYLFDKTGHFIAQIGDVGAGPGEYLRYSAQLARIDEKNNQLIIYVTPPKQAMYYDLNGKFIESITLLFDDIPGLISFHHSFYLHKKENYGRVPYTYTVLDTDFNIITKNVKPVNYSWKDYLAYPAVPLFSQYTYNKQVHIRESMLNDTLYVINDDFSFAPKYIINSGKYDVSVDLRSDDGFRFAKEVRNCVILHSMFETDDYLFLLYEYQTKRIPCYYHKRENKVIHIASSTSGIPNDFDGGLDFWPAYQNDKELVTFYDAYQLVEHKNKLKLQGGEEAIGRFDQMIRKIDSDDNPVMVIVTLK